MEWIGFFFGVSAFCLVVHQMEQIKKLEVRLEKIEKGE